MIPNKLFLAGKPLLLDPKSFIAAGGEGTIYDWCKGQVVKIYHQPPADGGAKLRDLLRLATHPAFPPQLLVPQKLLTDEHGRVAGFTMRRLPSSFQTFKKLSQVGDMPSHAASLLARLPYLLQVRETLSRLHHLGLVVGDLNDQNLYYDRQTAGSTAWLDVDSYQLGRYPCPVAAPHFLDPHLYHISDFATRPAFSQSSDWYAFAVLFFQSILGVHPFGGVHQQLKTLPARAAAGVTIFDPDVQLPPTTTPNELLSPPLRQLLLDIFRHGRRPVINREWIDDYALFLKRAVPAPQKTAAAPAQIPPQTPQALLAAEGAIVDLWPQPAARWAAVVESVVGYRFFEGGRGGVTRVRPLFSATTPCRFGFTGRHLVANPAGTGQLLLFDVAADPPPPPFSLETAVLTGGSESTAVFATSSAALYRIAQGYIMRGAWQNGRWQEEVVGTAYREGTRLQADSQSDRLAALHLCFGRLVLWLYDAQGGTLERPLALPSPSPPLTALSLTFSNGGVTISNSGRTWHESVQLSAV